MGWLKSELWPPLLAFGSDHAQQDTRARPSQGRVLSLNLAAKSSYGFNFVLFCCLSFAPQVSIPGTPISIFIFLYQSNPNTDDNYHSFQDLEKLSDSSFPGASIAFTFQHSFIDPLPDFLLVETWNRFQAKTTIRVGVLMVPYRLNGEKLSSLPSASLSEPCARMNSLLQMNLLTVLLLKFKHLTYLFLSLPNLLW